MRTIGLAVSEKKIFEIVDDDGRTDGRTPEHGYTISSPMSLRLRCAKKDKCCAPIGTGKLYNNPLIITNGQILFLISFTSFKIISAHMSQANQ